MQPPAGCCFAVLTTPPQLPSLALELDTRSPVAEQGSGVPRDAGWSSLAPKACEAVVVRMVNGGKLGPWARPRGSVSGGRDPG